MTLRSAKVFLVKLRMSVSREELLVYGFIKEWHKSNGIDLLPRDVIGAFMKWIKLFDSFDAKFCHENIEFDPEIPTKFKRCQSGLYPTVIGSFIIEKGMKQSWTISTDGPVMIGIMDEKSIQMSSGNITDFTSANNKGFGIITNGWYYFHAHWAEDGQLIKYAEQFEATKPLIVEMVLDMTQNESEHGILKYIIQNEKRKDVAAIKTDGEYSNIAYDTININNKYRLALASGVGMDEWCELIE